MTCTIRPSACGIARLYVSCARSHIGSASGQAWKEGKMDFTGAQMVLTLKLISVAVCYQDGLKKEEVRIASVSCVSGIIMRSACLLHPTHCSTAPMTVSV